MEKKFAYTCEFNENFSKKNGERTMLSHKLRKVCRKYVSRNYYQKCARETFPFINTIRSYKVKEYLINDIISGLTVGVMQIPQGMAYAMLSSLPPICGLYISFFGPLVYFFLGTSRHVSMGCISIVSLMIGSVLDDAMSNSGFNMEGRRLPQNLTLLSAIGSSGYNGSGYGPLNLTVEGQPSPYVSQGPPPHASINAFKIELASALSLISGIVMVILGRLGFGVITTYMPEPMVSGFTSAVAVQIITAQAKHIFGLDVVRHNGYYKIIKTWVDILKNIGDTQWLPLVIFCVSFIILYSIKVHINIRFKAKLKVPIPADLIVVVLATVIAYAAKLSRNNGLNVVKEIPAGFPSFSPPDLSLVIPRYLKDAVMIGIVAFTQTVSIAKILAQTNNYDINSNQEMVAYGAGSVVCSLFSGYIPAGSVGRSMVQEGAGGKTQVASLFGCLVVLVVIVAVGPLFYHLPQCVLSAVVLMSLRGMFLQYTELPSLWRKSKIDFMIWVVTAASTIVLDAEIGIIIGIVFSVFTVTVRTQRTDGYRASYVGETSVMKNIGRYQSVVLDGRPELIVICYHGPVCFANAEHFMRTVYRKSGLDPKMLLKTQRRQQQKAQIQLDVSEEKDVLEETLCRNDHPKIAIDFTSVNFIDLVGVKAIKRVHKDYQSADIELILVGCNDDVIDMFEKCDIMGEFSSSLFTSMELLLAHINFQQTSSSCNGEEPLMNGFCEGKLKKSHISKEKD
uniref:Sulfate anion transporter 1-like isoform X1 n=1 Tax=Crassostrea virginica TaxID=6565 RepID=A0A8B8DH83_CRAVI|nr:sulfate anion transporter 1-like isoform X1 [Crassostrea virginica]